VSDTPTASADATTVIAFDEGELPPAGTYAFDLDLSGQSGCDLIEQLVWLIGSLQAPYEIRANRRPIAADDIGDHFSRLTVWTTDRNNADFLLLMSELGVKVVRSYPAH
jgi:hypothetical protein